jgi:hypothetical protein
MFEIYSGLIVNPGWVTIVPRFTPRVVIIDQELAQKRAALVQSLSTWIAGARAGVASVAGRTLKRDRSSRQLGQGAGESGSEHESDWQVLRHLALCLDLRAYA